MLYDVVVIGSGPCGLAAVARILEETPSALFTNDEHARYWKKHRQHHNSLEREQRRRKGSTDSGYGSEKDDQRSPPSITVLDASSDEWLFSWKQRFRNLEISHLRSPLFFHPDPRDRDGLLAFAHESERVQELREIPNVVGRELSKHAKKRLSNKKSRRKIPAHLRIDGRDQIDYFTPSAQLFEDHCDTIIERYSLRNLVQKARVLDITFEAQPSQLPCGLFTIHTDSDIIYSRIVIIATGPSAQPQVPGVVQLPASAKEHGSMAHVFQPGGTCLPSHITKKLEAAPHLLVNVVIVGGGLTSAQLADLWIKEHTHCPKFHVHLLLRHSKLKQKHFDIDLPWVTKTRNQLMSTYWSADTDTDRLAMLRAARNGGSVNPPFAKILQKHVEGGRLSIHANTRLNLDKDCVWDDDKETWTKLSLESLGTELSSFRIPKEDVDHIVFCTGTSPSLSCVPFLQTLQRDIPIESLSGLPVLNDDLMYNDSTPLFFTGALAALRLGPGAANLAGARQGAERIAWKIEEILGTNFPVIGQKYQNAKETRGFSDQQSDGQDGSDHRGGNKASQSERNEFTGSFSNQFAALSLDH